MRNRKYLPFAFLAAFVNFSARADTLEALPTMFGGGMTCSEYLKRANSDDKVMQVSTMTYVSGYISATVTQQNMMELVSGYNKKLDKKVLKYFGQHGQSLIKSNANLDVFINDWVIKYCPAHPDEEMGNVAMDFYSFLQKGL